MLQALAQSPLQPFFFSMSRNVKFLSLGKRCVTSQKTAAEETNVGHDDLQFSCAAFG